VSCNQNINLSWPRIVERQTSEVQVALSSCGHRDEYKDALENDPARVHLDANINDMVYCSSLSFWPKAAVSEGEGEPIQNLSCTIDFTMLFCISQPLFNYNPTASHRKYFIMKVTTIPAPIDDKTRSKCIGGLQFFFLLHAIMDVMLISTTSLADCASHAVRRYLFYAFRCGLPFSEFHKFIQHQQATRCSTYTNAIIWQQCNNARYTIHNEVLPHYNQVGSGVSWREQLNQVLSGLWEKNASALNVGNAKEGKEKRHNVNHVPAGWMHPPLWRGFHRVLQKGS
jgi:hypothetical protein